MSPEVKVLRATAAETSVVANMMQLYIHDFSEFWFDQPQGDVEANGLYALPDNLQSYWDDPDRVALLVKLTGTIVGFAMLNVHAHSGKPVDWNMGEFFILRKYRRAGIGTAAAQAIFANFPGRWETAVARRNVGAQIFWQRQAEDHGAFEGLDLRTTEWNGPIFRFTVAPAKGPSS